MSEQQNNQINKRWVDNPTRFCRFCLFEDTDCEKRPLIHLFQKLKYGDIPQKVQSCLNVKLSPNDKIPPIMCQSCMEKVNYFSDFLELCSKSEKQLERMYGLDQCCSNSFQITPSFNWISDERIHTACKTESDFSVNYKPIRNQERKLARKKSVSVCQRGKSSALLMTQMRKPKEKHHELRSSKSSSSFKCQSCNKKFASIYDYQHHRKMVHQEGNMYKCKKCDKIFLDREKYLEHEKNHKIQCKICSVQVLAKNMGMHLHKHAEKFRTKPAMVFKTVASSKTPDQKKNCKICKKTFKTENRLTAHKKRKHETKKIRFSARRRRSNKLQVKMHLRRLLKARLYKCKFCGQHFSALKELQEHLTSHNGNKKKCPKCNKQFLYKKHFAKHVLQCFYAPSQTTLKQTLSLPNVLSFGRFV